MGYDILRSVLVWGTLTGTARRPALGEAAGLTAPSTPKPAKMASKKSAAASKRAKAPLPAPASLSLAPAKFELAGHRASFSW